MKGLLIANWIILGLAAIGWMMDPANASVAGLVYGVFLCFLTAKAWTQMEQLKKKAKQD